MKKITMLALMMSSFSAFAWGPVGHRAIGLIADAQLTPGAKAAVQNLLGQSSMADVANWADSVRSSGHYKQTVWYHFEKLADGTNYIDDLKSMPTWQQKKGGVAAAILESERIVRNTKASSSERTDALKFLIHFIGDLHQRLHTGRPEDNGATKIDVTWMGTDMNLHRVWDSGMIDTGHAELWDSGAGSVEKSVAYAGFLKSHFASKTISTEMNVEAWLNESMVMRPAVYNKIYETDQDKYQEIHLPEIDLRIYSAGLRLAATINMIFAGTPVPQHESDLIKKIETIVGPIDQWISLRP